MARISLVIAVISAIFCFSESLQINSDEVIIIPLSPNSFNWTSGDVEGTFSYSASLYSLPDLPKWLQLTYNPYMRMGFLFGTPPAITQTISNELAFIQLDIVSTNQETYETAAKEMALNILLKPDVPRRQIKMKIHNLNIEDMMDPIKQATLLDVFRSVLWPESSVDLHFIELDSALSIGGRRPAKREFGEGVIMTLGSRSEFSEALRDLEREVSPLWAFRPCPRDFKKTSVERYFRSKGFIVDWCSFKLMPENSALSTISPIQQEDVKTENPGILLKSHKVVSEEIGLWRSPARWELPRRSYSEDGLIAIFVPLIILLVLTGLLTAVIGVHPEGRETQDGQLYEGVFEEMPLPCVKNRMLPSGRTKSQISERTKLTLARSRDSTTPSINMLKMNSPFDSNLESTTRGSSPFIMASHSPSPTPASTLSRSAGQTAHSSLAYSDRTSTLGRREPPPYVGVQK
nr:EOG090X04W0 [Sida crystallina]